MAEFQTVASLGDLPPGQTKVIIMDGEEIAIANVAGTCHAFGNVCPHEGAPLSEGQISDKTVICPWHFTVFDIETGEPLQGLTDEPIPAYEVRIEGDAIQLRKR